MTNGQDARRSAAIDGYELLGRPADRDLQALVELAALVAGVPTAAINLITATEQHRVAAVGLEASVSSREDALCALTVEQDAPMVVADASRDERLRDHPMVNGAVDGVRFYAAHPLRTPDGTVIGTLCVLDAEPHDLTDAQARALSTVADRVVDVLELGLAARRLDAAHAASDERLAEFAGQASHDLKNPLAAITMSLEMALDEAEDLDPDGDSNLQPLLVRAARGADRLERMIGDLLAFGRGVGKPDVQEVDLREVAREVEGQTLDPASGAEVELGALPVVQGDAAQLRSLLQHLVGNALKFARPDAPARVSLSAERRDGVWRVEVADNGRGIEPDQRERVFEPFARLDKTVPGTGVGLATCKRIVEAHGGRIGLAEADGGGTLAWFELPAGS